MPRRNYQMTMNMMFMAILWNELELEELVLLREKMMIQERQKLLSSSLARPMSSPWWCLLNDRNDCSFLQTMGVDTSTHAVTSDLASICL